MHDARPTTEIRHANCTELMSPSSVQGRQGSLLIARPVHRATVMLIEGGPYGTTCARVGCMPSKLLIAAAEAAHAVATAPRFGVHHDGVIRIDGRAVMDRVRRERDRFVDFVLRDVDGIPEAERMRGHASFVDDHADVSGMRLNAKTSSSHRSRPTRRVAHGPGSVSSSTTTWSTGSLRRNPWR
jgi:dihydrolipoamide dehydrogenase